MCYHLYCYKKVVMKHFSRREQALGEIPVDTNTTTPKSGANADVSCLQIKIQNLEASLNLSLRNQKVLQDSLQFMLDLESGLRVQLHQKETYYQMRIKQLEKELAKTEDEFDDMKHNVEQIKQLLMESQAALQVGEQKISSKESQINKLQTSIREQKKVIEGLENEKLYSNLGGLSNHVKDEQEHLMYQLKDKYQKKVSELEYQLKRLEHSQGAERSKAEKVQKQLGQFKKWLGGLVGMEKVVAGCQKMIMKEVAKRLSQ